MNRKRKKAACGVRRRLPAPRAGQPPPAPDLDALAQRIGVLPDSGAAPMNLAAFESVVPATHLNQLFGIAVAPELFGIADLLWADNAIRQLGGTQALREGAREKMQQWYREHAMPCYFEKLQPPRPRRQEENGDGCSDMVAPGGEAGLH